MFCSNIRQKISEAIGMDAMFITSLYINNENKVFFTILETDQFSASIDNSGNVTADSLQLVQQFPKLEEVPF